jgi:hypothetical protein
VDRVITISRCQWQAFWRRFRRVGHLNAGNQGILLILSVLLLVRYLQTLRTAALDFSHGRPRVFESLLIAIFFVWLFPLTSNTRNRIAIRKLLHLPLTLKELFAIRLITLLLPPYTWIILGGSLAICYPIIRAGNSAAGVIAALLFIVFSGCTGLAIAQLLSMRAWRGIFFASLVLSGPIISYVVQRSGTERWSSVLPYLPTTLVTQAVLGPRAWVAVGELALLAVAAFLASLWSFKQSLQVAPKGRSQKLTIFNSLRIPGPAGALAIKDFRYFRRLLDPYLGVLAAAVGCLYLVTAEVASAGFFLVFLMSVLLLNAAPAFNSFGLDNRAGMDRLKLMPLTGATILFSKNLAFMMIVGLQIAPLIMLASWRLSPLVGGIGVIVTASMTAMYMAWGNWMSVNHPVKMQFFQFSSSHGQVLEVLTGIMLGSFPGMVAIYLMNTSGTRAGWKIGLLLLCSGFIYWVSVRQVGARFAQKVDRILNALS